MQNKIFNPWIIWFTAGIFYLFEFIHRVALSGMIPELIKTFQVSYSQLGTLSAYYFYAYAIAQIPIGLLIDHYGTRLQLTFACLLVTLGSFLFAATSNIYVADLCRLVIGLGSAFAFVGCLKLGANWFPAHKFAFVVGLTNLLGVTGAMIGGKPVAAIVDIYGWRTILFASGFIGCAITVLLLYVIRDSDKHTDIQLDNSYSLFASVFEAAKIKQIWLVAIFGGLLVAPIMTYAELWGVSSIVKNYQIDKSSAAQLTTLTFAGIGIGGPVIGWLSGILRLRKYPMLMGTSGALCTFSLMVYAPNMPLKSLYILHILFGFFTSSMLLCFSINSEITEPKIKATTIALTNTVIMAMGALFQTMSGKLLDISNNNYYLCFAPLILCYIIALLLLFLIKETNCKADRGEVCIT